MAWLEFCYRRLSAFWSTAHGHFPTNPVPSRRRQTGRTLSSPNLETSQVIDRRIGISLQQLVRGESHRTGWAARGSSRQSTVGTDGIRGLVLATSAPLRSDIKRRMVNSAMYALVPVSDRVDTSRQFGKSTAPLPQHEHCVQRPS